MIGLCMQFVEEANLQIEKHDRSIRQVGVLSYILRYASSPVLKCV